MYNSARTCLARVAFARDKAVRENVPTNPYALLCSAYHEVLEQLNKDHNLIRDPLVVVGERFDAVVAKMYAHAHWLLRAKYPSAMMLPGYNLQRARILEHFRTVLLRSAPATYEASGATRLLVEQVFYSKDGLLYGRVDLIDKERKEVIDYKTGGPPTENLPPIKEQELSQLRIYAYLARENGVEINRGVIVRSNGQAISVEMKSEQVQLEADRAKAALHDYTEAVDQGLTVEQLAQPSPENCHACPFIAFCAAFWQQATPDWAPIVGVHVQGQLTSITQTQGGSNLIALMLHPSGGTQAEASKLVARRIPINWISEDGINLPKPGDMIRVVNTWVTDGRGSAGQMKVDAATTIWTQDHT